MKRNQVAWALLPSRLVAGVAGAMLLSWAAAAQADDVMLNDGGRVRGTVFEESPTSGVRIKLPDGTIKVVPADQVKEVRYDSDAKRQLPTNEPATNLDALPPGDDFPPRPPQVKRDPIDTPLGEPEEPAKRKTPSPEAKVAQRMTIAGAVLTAVGFAGAIAGALTMGFGSQDTGPGGNGEAYLKAGAAGLAVGASVGITGSIVLGLGVEKRRDLRRDYSLTPGELAFPSLTGATLTFRFQ